MYKGLYFVVFEYYQCMIKLSTPATEAFQLAMLFKDRLLKEKYYV